MEHRASQSDIARHAGVHRSCVSLALRNHPRIPLATRERIHAIAKELGYAPDPMLSALSAYRNRNQAHSYQGVLAWLAWPGWEKISIYREYLEGAKARAKSHGYTVEVFELGTEGVSPRRLASVMISRNIQGILVCPRAQAQAALNFKWDDFSVITFGYSLLSPQLHAVAATQYRGVLKAMKHLKELGYKRVGYAVWSDFNKKTDNNCLAGYLVTEYENGRRTPIPIYDGPWHAAKIRDWFIENRLDAILTSDIYFLNVLKECGLEAPRDLGVACFALSCEGGQLSGVYENSSHVGEVAVDSLVAMIQRGEKGEPKVAQRVLVEGDWHPGQTVRKL